MRRLDALIARFEIPTQSCVLTHVTSTIALIERGAPIDLVFQSIAGTEAANASFGVNLAVLGEGLDAARSLQRGGRNVMYFETGQGSALSAGAHHGLDQQTAEARAYAVARVFEPLLVNTVVGFIGPEYLYDGKQIIRAGLEDHFCGKLLGVPMGCDVCYTNHAEADQDDMDVLLTLLATAGVTFVIGVPGADDVMLNYQSTSFHDALYVRALLGLKRAPEFETWLQRMQLTDAQGRLVASCRRASAAGECDRRRRMTAPARSDRWAALAAMTPARIALGRAGSSLPTREVLAFALDHARARDAVHIPFDAAFVAAQIEALGLETLEIASAAPDRANYLRRPDLGRRLSPESQALLDRQPRTDPDLVVIVADGLSSTAVHAWQARAACFAALALTHRGAGMARRTRRLGAPGPRRAGRRDRRAAGRALRGPAGRRAAGPFSRRQPRRLPHLRPAHRPPRRRAQLHLQHPASGPRLRGRCLQDRLAHRRLAGARVFRGCAEGREQGVLPAWRRIRSRSKHAPSVAAQVVLSSRRTRACGLHPGSASRTGHLGSREVRFRRDAAPPCARDDK